jgi:DNA-binding NtrC family response regulator
MKCHFLDDRTEFFAVLGEKLGGDFHLSPASLEDRDELLKCDVLITSLPSTDDPEYEKYLDRLQHVVRNPLGVPVVALVSTTDRQVARTALAAGAYDYFVETGSLEEFRIVLRRAAQFHELHCELQALRASAVRVSDFISAMGTNSKMREIYNFASKVAPTDATVLLTGETGTGKEVLARAIHQASRRAKEPFVALACSSLPETLIEAELFGHERGAYTGADSARRGYLEAAERGTLFLDEIGELSPGLQVKLLRVLQDRTFERLGSNQVRKMDARIICATNRVLPVLVKAGSFRADLFYRLNTIEIALPPLRERREDIILLASSFLQNYAERHGRPARRISAAAMSALQEHDWPGNVRELQNVMERAVVICDGTEIRMEHLPGQFYAWEESIAKASFDEEVRSFKRRLIQRVLMEFDNNKLQAARSLGIARSSLHRLIDELQVSSPRRDGNMIH